MHAWHTKVSTNLQVLEDEFDGFEHDTDDGREEARGIRFINREFTNETEAAEAAGSASYGDNRAVCYPVIGKKKKTKAYEAALQEYTHAKSEHTKFMKVFSFALGKKAALITCPRCKSKISSVAANSRHMQVCPVCGSHEIMPETTRKKLAKSEQSVAKAAIKLSKAADKCDITFVARLEWHE